MSVKDSESESEGLGELFAELKREARTGPNFEGTWAAAEKQAAAERRVIPLVFLGAGVSTLGLAAAAALLLIFLLPASPSAPGLAAAVAPVSHQPLDFLLTTPSIGVAGSEVDPFRYRLDAILERARAENANTPTGVER